MSESFSLEAELRVDQGKGASRRLRKVNKMPAIVYGAGKDPVTISVAHNVMQLSLEHEAFYTQIIDLSIAGAAEKVVLRDLQRHPYKNIILHADFQRVDMKSKLHVTVPLHFINEENCHGVKVQGGALSHLLSEVEIQCLPKDLPEYIEVDVLNLELGHTLHLTELKLPEGVELMAMTHGAEDHDTGVATVHKTRAASESEDGEASDGE